MMFGDGALAFREFAMGEPTPLAKIHDAVMEFLADRDDVVLHGAQAVNAYVDEPRMTQDVDLLAIGAESFAVELRKFLNDRLHIAVRHRSVQNGLGHRLYQIRESKNRHLVDIRSVEVLPPSERVASVAVLQPAALIAAKTVSYCNRKTKPKGFTDLRDLAVLLLAFPELKVEWGEVRDQLNEMNADSGVLAEWKEIVERRLDADDDDLDW